MAPSDNRKAATSWAAFLTIFYCNHKQFHDCFPKPLSIEGFSGFYQLFLSIMPYNSLTISFASVLENLERIQRGKMIAPMNR